MARRLILCLWVLAAFSTAKDRNWKEGRIVQSNAVEADLGNVHPVSHGRSYDFTPKTALETHGRSWIAIPSYGTRETYVIETAGGERVVATRVLQSDKPSKLSGMREVRFAVVKGSVFLLDAKGREHNSRWSFPSSSRRRGAGRTTDSLVKAKPDTSPV